MESERKSVYHKDLTIVRVGPKAAAVEAPPEQDDSDALDEASFERTMKHISQITGVKISKKDVED